MVVVVVVMVVVDVVATYKWKLVLRDYFVIFDIKIHFISCLINGMLQLFCNGYCCQLKFRTCILNIKCIMAIEAIWYVKKLLLMLNNVGDANQNREKKF